MPTRNIFDCFPTVVEVLHDLRDLTDADYRQLAEVIAHHEIGHVSTEYASTLRWLADHFVVGLVTNLWSEKTLWLRELERAGVASLFRTMVFSSDHSSIKPSPKLFEMALANLGCNASNVVFIVDDLHRDMEGAQALGLRTLWIGIGDPRPSVTDGIILICSIFGLATVVTSECLQSGTFGTSANQGAEAWSATFCL